MSNLLFPLRTWVFLYLLSWPLWGIAEEVVPILRARVTDLTSTLSVYQQQSLERRLGAFEARKGSQLAILIVPTTAPETIEQYSMRVVEKWKLGRKNVDDGVLLLVAKNDHTLRIEVGYGLEGALNDATCKRIISEVIVPQFKQGNYYGGIQEGMESMIKVVDGEPLPPVTMQSLFNKDLSKASPELFITALIQPLLNKDLSKVGPVLFIALIGGVILRGLFGAFFGALLTGGIIAVIAWLMTGVVWVAFIAGLIAAIFTLISGSNSGRVGSHRRGGFRGSGFGGGSGGGFGGGGASGRW